MLERVWRKGNALALLVEVKIDIATMEDSMEIPQKTRNKPPYDPAIPVLGIHPEETKIVKDTCIPLFNAALFTIARTRKQPRCPSTDEWMKNLWSIYTMEYSVQFSHSVVSDSLQPHELQHTRALCLSPTPGVYSNSCPLSW